MGRLLIHHVLTLLSISIFLFSCSNSRDPFSREFVIEDPNVTQIFSVEAFPEFPQKIQSNTQAFDWLKEILSSSEVDSLIKFQWIALSGTLSIPRQSYEIMTQETERLWRSKENGFQNQQQSWALIASWAVFLQSEQSQFLAPKLGTINDLWDKHMEVSKEKPFSGSTNELLSQAQSWRVLGWMNQLAKDTSRSLYCENQYQILMRQFREQFLNSNTLESMGWLIRLWRMLPQENVDKPFSEFEKGFQNHFSKLHGKKIPEELIQLTYAIRILLGLREFPEYVRFNSQKDCAEFPKDMNYALPYRGKVLKIAQQGCGKETQALKVENQLRKMILPQAYPDPQINIELIIE